MADRESGLAERERRDQEKADENRRRQLRQGHVSDSADEGEETPKPKAKASAKKSK